MPITVAPRDRTANALLLAALLAVDVGACATVSPAPSTSPEAPLRSGVDDLAAGVTPRVVTARRTSVAIVGFVPVQGARSAGDAFAQYLVEELTTRLVNDGKVTVAERAQLDKVMHELKLQASGLVSDASAKQLGQLLGVDAVLCGTYTDLGESVRVNERIIATETGQVLAATSTTIRKTRMVARLLGQPYAGPDDGPPRAPLYKRWWFWTIIGGAVAGGVVATALATGGDKWVATSTDGRYDSTSYPNK
jgi:TolB-like protein